MTRIPYVGPKGGPFCTLFFWGGSTNPVTAGPREEDEMDDEPTDNAPDRNGDEDFADGDDVYMPSSGYVAPGNTSDCLDDE